MSANEGNSRYHLSDCLRTMISLSASISVVYDVPGTMRYMCIAIYKSHEFYGHISRH